MQTTNHKAKAFQATVQLVWSGLRQVDPDATEEQAVLILMDCMRVMEDAAPCLLVELLAGKKINAAGVLNPPRIDRN